MNILSIILLVIGIISLIYYGIIIIYAGISSSFSFAWLILGICCIVICCIIKYMVKNDISISHWLRILIISILSIGIFIFAVIEGTIIYHSNDKTDKNSDYLIVLGAQIRGTRITKSLKKRLDTAAVYLKENPKTIAITSGGQGYGEDLTEADAMKNYLISCGVDEKRIRKEEASTDTNENIRNCKKMLRNNATVAIVTNGFHIFRAVSIAKKQGIKKVKGLSAPSDPILLVNYYVREVIGVIKDKLMGNL